MKGRAKPQTSWSDSDVAILTQGKLEGKSASQIAADLQAAGRVFSRNAVIGRLHRMFKKLPGDHELVQARRAALAANRAEKEQAPARPKIRPPTRATRFPALGSIAFPEPLEARERPPGLFLEDDWPGSACRYPLFADAVDPTGPIFCGEPISKRSFCAHHYALCWTKPQRPVRLASDREPPPSKAREFIFGRRHA